MNTEMNRELKTERYLLQRELWPASGRHIMAQYNEEAILVYQAYNKKIADYAVQIQKLNGPDWSSTRMTWIKTNFLWMMFRSNWARKKNQDHILGIWLKLESFNKYLRMPDSEKGTVRIQDPDHYPSGDRHPLRKAVQLGLKNVQGFINGDDIVLIQDLTEFVHAQHEALENNLDELVIPEEKIYSIEGLVKQNGLEEKSHLILLSYRGKQKPIVMYGRDEKELLDLVFQKFKVKPKSITTLTGDVLTKELLNVLPKGSTLFIH
ncbi:altered inheritance of mitochondria protein [Acrasis kona]|uniref:Altered inheritance of mitochondria protein n=1 Tax=Acrasis kona TaxID=1008807 RepID=A0AAW2YK68_9EUKA